MQVHGPDPGFMRPVEMPPAPLVAPTVQSAVAVTPADDAQSGENNVKFQDPNRDGRRSLYQELGGRYVGFFRTKDLNVQRTLNIELDFGPSAAKQEFIITMEAFLETGFNSIHHGVGLTANLIADENGQLVAMYPPLVKILADPLSILGFHVYAFPVGQPNKKRDNNAKSESAAGPSKQQQQGQSKLNLRPPGGGSRFDGSA